MYIKVAVYIRKSGTREYQRASRRANCPGGTIFCLRYTEDGKRNSQTLSVFDYKRPTSLPSRSRSLYSWRRSILQRTSPLRSPHPRHRLNLSHRLTQVS
jgi:hypothetical protein